MLRLRTAVVAGLCTSRCAVRSFSLGSFGDVQVLPGDSIGGAGLVLANQKHATHKRQIGGGCDSAVVWLHGLGDTAEGWLEPMAALAQAHQTTRFVLPTASSVPVTLNGGLAMPAWMDIVRLGGEEPVDQEGLDRSARRVLAIVEQQIREGVPRERVVIGGFSQGGAVALHATMAYDMEDDATGEKHAPAIAAIACSTWLPLAAKYPAMFKQTSTQVRVLQCHGDEDPVVRREWGVSTISKLKALLTHPVEYKEYPMQHSASMEEIEDIGKFLGRVLAPSTT